MPISKEEFESGRVLPELEKSVISFLEKSKQGFYNRRNNGRHKHSNYF
jgi:hypothetical protein